MKTKEEYMADVTIFADTGVFIEPEDPLKCMHILEELKNA